MHVYSGHQAWSSLMCGPRISSNQTTRIRLIRPVSSCCNWPALSTWWVRRVVPVHRVSVWDSRARLSGLVNATWGRLQSVSFLSLPRMPHFILRVCHLCFLTSCPSLPSKSVGTFSSSPHASYSCNRPTLSFCSSAVVEPLTLTSDNCPLKSQYSLHLDS
jgi:hypothetical protein